MILPFLNHLHLFYQPLHFNGKKNLSFPFFWKFQNSIPPSLMGGSCSKMNFSKKSPFLKNSSTFKARYKKTMRSTQCIVQVGMSLYKKIFLKICNIEANIEYFAFLNCCNLTFSQTEIIIKFLKNFIKEGLNFVQMKYRGFFLV